MKKYRRLLKNRRFLMLSLYMDGYQLIHLQYKLTKTVFKRPTMEAKLPLLLSLIQIR